MYEPRIKHNCPNSLQCCLNAYTAGMTWVKRMLVRIVLFLGGTFVVLFGLAMISGIVFLLRGLF